MSPLMLVDAQRHSIGGTALGIRQMVMSSPESRNLRGTMSSCGSRTRVWVVGLVEPSALKNHDACRTQLCAAQKSMG